MRRYFLLLLAVSLGSPLYRAQTPTLVQHVSCPNSGELGSGIPSGPQSSAPVYQCPLPEPTQAGNAILLGLFSDNSGNPKWTVSDDKSNTWTLAGSTTDSNSNIVAVYYALNVAAGTRMLSVKNSGGTNGDIAVSASEYYNVATSSALDAHSCSAGASSKIISAGSVTPGTAGDLLWQWAADANSAAVSSFAAGSQSNIAWQLNGTDINASDATQAGVYNATAAIDPTFTSGTAVPFDSCVMALRAASAGNPPSRAFRIVHMLHAEMINTISPYPVEIPTSGNLFVISFSSGGNTITTITGTPLNTWTSTGGPTNPDNQTYYPDQQVYYAANATPSNTMTLNIGQAGSSPGTTFMIYDFVGAASSPFDGDSGGQEGDQAPNPVTQLTTCSGCLTPSSANEVILGNVGQDWCTATGVVSPSGALFDSATYTGNSVNGPEPVDQNNGWFHYYDAGTGALTATWSYVCGTYAEEGWSGRLTAFKGAPGNQPEPPTNVKATAVAQ